jgi:hypothetical protein
MVKSNQLVTIEGIENNQPIYIQLPGYYYLVKTKVKI